MNGPELQKVREALHLTAADLGRHLGYVQRDPGRPIRDFESGVRPVPGWMPLALLGVRVKLQAAQYALTQAVSLQAAALREVFGPPVAGGGGFEPPTT